MSLFLPQSSLVVRVCVCVCVYEFVEFHSLNTQPSNQETLNGKASSDIWSSLRLILVSNYLHQWGHVLCGSSDFVWNHLQTEDGDNYSAHLITSFLSRILSFADLPWSVWSSSVQFLLLHHAWKWNSRCY